MDGRRRNDVKIIINQDDESLTRRLIKSPIKSHRNNLEPATLQALRIPTLSYMTMTLSKTIWVIFRTTSMAAERLRFTKQATTVSLGEERCYGVNKACTRAQCWAMQQQLASAF